MKYKTTLSAFSLIELLIAVFIFSIVSIASYSGLNLLITSAEKVKPHQEFIDNISTTFITITDDIMHIANRNITDHLGNSKAALIIQGESQNSRIMEFSRFNAQMLGLITDSPIQRIAYTLEDGVLYRGFWKRIDRSGFDVTPHNVKLIDNIEEIEIKILYSSNKTNINEYNSILLGIPKLIEIVLTIEGLGDYSIMVPVFLSN